MEIAIICLVAFGASVLTFFSGFGLGTLLTPVFAVFFPVELAIALTGVVHFFNNLFKLFLVGKFADREVVFRFGVPAVIAAFIGSLLLVNISDLPALFTYTFNGHEVSVYPVKFIVALLLIVFALIDIIPYFGKLAFEKKWLPIGGVMSGFFGGLSGVQGALRSAFLIKAGLSKETFLGTAVVVSTFVDFTRLGVYTNRFSTTGLSCNFTLVILATFSAITGAYLGNKLLKKVTLRTVQLIVAVLLIVISIALSSGLI